MNYSSLLLALRHRFNKTIQTKLLKRPVRAKTFRRALLERLEIRTVMDGSVIISEILTSNSGGLVDADGDSSDWIELYNPTSTTINLDGWHLTDDVGDLNEWRLPAVSIGANDFLTVFASGKNRAVAGSELHTNFKLSVAGDYLALVQPDGTIVSEFTPTYPTQASNVSYGAVFDSSVLIQSGSTAQILVPTNGNLGNNWTQPDFNADSWTAGPLSVGFGVSEPGFDVTYIKSNVIVGDLDVARDVLTDASKHALKVESSLPVVNFLGTGSGAHFANDLAFPTQNVGEDFDDFVVQAVGTLQIPAAGFWTFGVNSDDGFSLLLENNGTVFSSEYFNPRGTDDTLATFNIPSVGSWKATLVMYERGGGASVELFAAPGSFASFDPTAFDLVGDTASGGLAVFHGLAVNTNLQSQMLGINSSAYIRIPFTTINPSNYESLVLRMQYDDGFAAYLNGVEVARRNAPANLAFDSASQTKRDNAQVSLIEAISLTDHLDLLVPGQNVLAIHGLNSASLDESFLIFPELRTISVDTDSSRFFETPTPNEVNSNPFLGVVERVSASVAGGFYSTPFTVSLSTPTAGATIRYTLDGSTPTSTIGSLYAGPITVSSTTTLRSAAFITSYVSLPSISRTYLFVADIINQSTSGDPPAGWPSSWSNNVVDYGMDPDIIALHGASAVENALKAIPSLALTTDLGNLFDPVTGIYANAYGDGREWERPASLELLNPDGTPGFQVNSGVRIRGGYSRSGDNPKHAFRLFFRGSYGDSSLDYPMFGPGSQSLKKLDLRTAQNYSWSFGGDPNNTFIGDIFSRESQRDMGQPYSRSNWYHLYINGQYWGLFQTQERTEAEYAASYFGGIASNYDVLKPEAGPYEVYATDGNDQAYRRLWEGSNVGFANNEDFLKVQGKNLDGTDNLAYEALLDVDNLVVYMINILYSGNLDAPISNFLGNERVNNFYAVRDRTGRSGFKYFLHDSEHTLLPWALNENRNGPYPAGSEFRYFNPQWLHQRLMENAEYRIHFADKVQEAFFGIGPLTVAANQARYQNQINQIDQAIIAESARWGDAKRPDNPLGRIDWLNATAAVRDGFLTQRGDIVLNQWRDNGLFPTVHAPTFLVDGNESFGGQIVPGSNLRFGASQGLVYYTTNSQDPRLQGGGINPDAQVYDPGASTDTLLSEGSSWRYHDDGGNLGSEWIATSYDDGSWSTGNAELGYGDGDETTVVDFGPDPNNRYITTYFRKNFSVVDSASITSLTLRLKRDDGAVVYLNGTEVVRNNMPTGAINSSTLAVNAVGGADESTFLEFTIDKSVLLDGDNVLAVEIHQSAASSSDISFDASLVASRQTNSGLILNSSTSIIARTLSAGGIWSARNVANFNAAIPADSTNFAIRELMYNPPASSAAEPTLDKEEFEFVEFQNIGSVPISLEGVKFSTGISFEFNSGAVPFLNPGQIVVVARNQVAFRARYGEQPLLAGTYGTSGTNLSNGGEAITLLAADGSTIQSFTYDDVDPWPVSPDGSGYSLTARWTNDNYNSSSNWRASYILQGSPGIEENDFPEQLTLSTDVIEENVANATVGTLAALDPNLNEGLTFTIMPGDDGSQFQIVENQLRVGQSGLDFEAGATRKLTVRATDSGALFVDKLLTIQVTNVNESPTGLQISADSLQENLPAGSVIGTLNTADPDLGDGFSYTLVAGEGDTDNDQFEIVGDQLRSLQSFDFESKPEQSVRVQVRDAGGQTLEKKFLITVQNANDDPTGVQLFANQVDENSAIGTVMGVLSTTDADVGDSFAYTLVTGEGDTDNDQFEIVGDQLRSLQSFDFESKSEHSVRIQTRDSGGETLEQILLVTVQNANEVPTGLQLSSNQIDENAAIGTAIGVLSTTDPDAGDSFAYTLVSGEGDTENDHFEIVDNQLRSLNSLDFESKPINSIRIKSTDFAGLAVTRTLVISVVNRNDPPTAIVLSNESIGEALPKGTTVGIFQTVDQDTQDSHSYRLIDGSGSDDNATFQIVGTNLVTTQSFDFESKRSYVIRLESRDSQGAFFQQAFTISVVDVYAAEDTSQSGLITPTDALLVINYLNSALDRLSNNSNFLLDVNRSGLISPTDALVVINILNSHTGEGESNLADQGRFTHERLKATDGFFAQIELDGTQIQIESEFKRKRRGAARF